MVLEMKIPSPGESITEVEISQWMVKDGDIVSKDQTIAELDSDKATLDLPAEASGKITFKAQEGDTILVGDIVCLIDTSQASIVSESSNDIIEDNKRENFKEIDISKIMNEKIEEYSSIFKNKEISIVATSGIIGASITSGLCIVSFSGISTEVLFETFTV